MTKSVVTSDVCLSLTKFNETDKFLNNLKSTEEDSGFRDFAQKVKISLGNKNKNINHLHPHSKLLCLSPFKLCPFVHAEVGLWKTISCGMVKIGCVDSNSRDVKHHDPKNYKMLQKSFDQLKKISKNKSRDTAVCLRQNIFRHDVPVEEVLNEYREKTIYSKCRLSKVDSKAMYNAIHSSKLKNEHLTPNNPSQDCEEVSTHIINLCFDEDAVENSLNRFTRVTKNNQKKSFVQPGMDSKNSQVIPKKIESNNKCQTNIFGKNPNKDEKKNKSQKNFGSVKHSYFTHSKRN